MKNKLLRSFIKECIITESAVKSIPEGLCVSVFDVSQRNCLIIGLWDIDEFIIDIMAKLEWCVENQLNFEVRKLSLHIFGMMQFGPLNSKAWNDGGHGWYVQASSAEKGYGPLMYQIALGQIGPFTSDRTSVSQDAARVWKGFKSGMTPGVSLKKLDDEDNPKTKTKKDDSRMADLDDKVKTDREDEWRDWALVGDGINPAPWINKGTKTLKKLIKDASPFLSKLNLTKKDFEIEIDSLILQSIADFFDKKYYDK